MLVDDQALSTGTEGAADPGTTDTGASDAAALPSVDWDAVTAHPEFKAKAQSAFGADEEFRKEALRGVRKTDIERQANERAAELAKADRERADSATSASAMTTVNKASVYSRTGEDTPETPSLASIDRFLDAVWMERGLSPNTLSAYRADLTALDRWLHERQRDYSEDGKDPGAVDAGGILQFFGDTQKELAQQEDSERPAESR